MSSSHPSHTSSEAPRDAAASATACFAVRALADPGALPRILELFAKRGLVPSSVHASLSGTGAEARLVIDVQVDDLAPALAETIAESLRQTVIVERVLTARKRLAAQAA